MKTMKRYFASLVAVVVATAAVSAAVQAWRRQQQTSPRRAPRPRDEELADRIRSELGAVEHELDIPRIHVVVVRGVAVLHGEVPSDAAQAVLGRRVREVRGVRHVVSRLHVGLIAGDTRPSAGDELPSRAAVRLTIAARGAAAGEVTAELAARAVLRSFAALLPPPARRRIASHLSHDVVAWLQDLPVASPSIETVDELYADVLADGVIPAAHAPWVVGAVLRELASLLPDDAPDLVSELPTAIGHLWADAFVEAAAR